MSIKQRTHSSRRRDKQQTQTFAVTYIRLGEINAGKLTALDEVAQVYLALCQQYVTLFYMEELPDNFRSTCFATPLYLSRLLATIQPILICWCVSSFNVTYSVEAISISSSFEPRAVLTMGV